MAVFYDVSQLTTGDLEYEINQLTISLKARKELIALGIIDDTVQGNRKYFMTDKIGELTRQRDSLLAACETVWSELKNKLASIEVHPGFPFEDDSPCTVYFLDRIVHCDTMTEGIAKCDELMAEEFPEAHAAITGATVQP